MPIRSGMRAACPRKRLGVLAVSVLTIGVAGQAHAVALDFNGLLTLQIATLPPVVLQGGSVGSVTRGHLTDLTFAGDRTCCGEVFEASRWVVPVTDPAAFPVVGLQATFRNGPAAFAGVGGGGFGGVMPLIGSSKVCLFGASCTRAGQNLTVPLSVVGKGGTAHATAGVNLTVIGAPWTTGTAAVGTITAMGGVSPLSNTARGSGEVTLVTPVFISTNIGASAVLPSFGILSLHFTPEPATLTALACGLVGLAALRRSKRV